MDLFDALVRLEAAGWVTGAPRPTGDVQGPAALVRILRKLSTLAPPDGSSPYDLGRAPEPGFARGPEMVRLRDGPDGVTWMLVHDGSASVWVVDALGGITLRAPTVSAWLAGLLAEPVVASEEPARALWDLGVDGEGWGWSLEGVEPPIRFDRSSLPEELRAEPLHLDGRVLWAGQRVLDAVPAPPGTAPLPTDADVLLGSGRPEVDELFGESGAGRPRPRVVLISGLLVSGLVLTVAGMTCIAAPGGILVLLAWMHVEKDIERLESGYLPETDRPLVERLRRFTYGGLLIVVALFALQGFLLCNGVYDVLLDEVYLPFWQSFVRGLLEG